MRPLMVVLLVVIVAIVGWRLYDYYGRVDANKSTTDEKRTAEIRPDSLPGLPYQLEQPLHDAQAAGPERFKIFLDGLKRYPDVKDPRLAWIQLDYVVMISNRDPIEAKKLFAEIKKRTPADSPVMPRIRALAKTYEP